MISFTSPSFPENCDSDRELFCFELGVQEMHNTTNTVNIQYLIVNACFIILI